MPYFYDTVRLVLLDAVGGHFERQSCFIKKSQIILSFLVEACLVSQVHQAQPAPQTDHRPYAVARSQLPAGRRQGTCLALRLLRRTRTGPAQPPRRCSARHCVRSRSARRRLKIVRSCPLQRRKKDPWVALRATHGPNGGREGEGVAVLSARSLLIAARRQSPSPRRDQSARRRCTVRHPSATAPRCPRRCCPR